MSGVVPIRATPPGDRSFLCCPCEPENGEMLVVVMHDAAGAFICALVCPRCDSEVPVSDGRPAMSGDPDPRGDHQEILMSDAREQQQPSVGRIVLYTPPAGYVPLGNRSAVPGNNAAEYLAMIGQIVGDGDCNLYVMPPFADAFWEGTVKEGEGPRTWRWPPRV